MINDLVCSCYFFYGDHDPFDAMISQKSFLNNDMSLDKAVKIGRLKAKNGKFGCLVGYLFDFVHINVYNL